MLGIEVAVVRWQVFKMELGYAVLPWQILRMEFGVCRFTWSFVVSCSGPVVTCTE